MSSEELPRPESKIKTLGELIECVAEWRAAGLKVVFTNGCFDLLHIGHEVLLDGARREGGRLVVGIYSDNSVARPDIVSKLTADFTLSTWLLKQSGFKWTSGSANIRQQMVDHCMSVRDTERGQLSRM